ncbi:serine/threonine-protein kinase [Neobacillus jeddahensis]|uniref:hypothetical protein n=1 Tax=Neobacillus jeddahensis TaxID=1461580 RepID=UPI00058B5859|nr:hypothetical protein [Neobacillus jeddahensis]
MDTNQLELWLQDIQVQNMVNADVEVINNSPLQMLGKGRQGAVFQVTEDICVKVFGNEEDCEREHYALSLGQGSGLFPNIHAKGPLYIAMDIIHGVDLREYLQSQPLTPELSAKLIEMLVIFKTIGFERIDHHKRQIFIQPDGTLKVIDVARTVWRDRVYPYPRKLLTSLGEENKDVFLTHVQEMAPELYGEWMHYIRMEELSRQIYQVLLPQKEDKVKLKKMSQQLATTEDEEQYVLQLTGLVHKVFKEEWIKTMLARGADPDAVMTRIDEYWKSLEHGQYRHLDRFLIEGRRFAGEKHHDFDKHPIKKKYGGEKVHKEAKGNKKKHKEKKRHHS